MLFASGISTAILSLKESGPWRVCSQGCYCKIEAPYCLFPFIRIVKTFIAEAKFVP